MKKALTLTAVAILVSAALPAPAKAQAVVVGPVAVSPSPARPTVVCEVRREPISDERGWRVRDIVICYTPELRP
jgi:hypothetical protein